MRGGEWECDVERNRERRDEMKEKRAERERDLI